MNQSWQPLRLPHKPVKKITRSSRKIPSPTAGGSTDVGDVQHLQPVLTFNTGGKVSGLHSVDFDIVDDELAYVVTAKIFALLQLTACFGTGRKSEGNCRELSAHLYQRGVYQIYGFLY